MTDHPEFPQADPATKYIVSQVAKIEDATSCTMGYYKSFNKLLTALKTTNDELSQMRKLIDGLDNKELQKQQLMTLRDGVRDLKAELSNHATSLEKQSDNKIRHFKHVVDQYAAKLDDSLSHTQAAYASLKNTRDEIHAVNQIAKETNEAHLKTIEEKITVLVMNQKILQEQLDGFVNTTKKVNFSPAWQTIALIAAVGLLGIMLGVQI